MGDFSDLAKDCLDKNDGLSGNTGTEKMAGDLLSHPEEKLRNCAGSDVETNNCAGSDVETNNCAGSDVETNNCAGSDVETNNSAGSDVETNNCAGCDVETNNSAGSDVETNNCAGSDVETNNCAGSDRETNNCAGSDVETNNYAGSDVERQDPVESETARCSAVTSLFYRSVHPVLASSHPLPDHPTTLRKIGQWFLFPPTGKVAAILLVCFMFAAWFATLISIAKKQSLPGGSLFPMLVLFMSSWSGGYVIKPTSLPPLLGMLIVGVMLRNIPGIDIATQIDPVWSSTARSMALTVILTRAGLGLDPVALKRLSFVVPRLAFCPSIAEVVVDGVAARFILGMPWTWAFMLAFVLAVVSPAVVVPSILSLSERGYGLDKGIPTLVIAACSLDAVLAVTGFGVMLSINFSTGNIVWTVIQGALEPVVGIAFGVVYGVVLWYLPQKSSKNLVLFRSAMLLAGGLLAIFGSKAVDWSGSGPLGCLTVAFVAAYRWRDDYRQTKIKNPVEDVTAALWMVFQPLLFGLIGATVNIATLEPSTVGFAIAIVCMGLVVRMSVAFLTVQRTDLNLKERFFIPLSWFPKATVQAAIGAVAYDTAVEKGATDLIPLGKKILNIAVLAILFAAPIGSVLITLIGPRLLHRTDPDQPISDEKNDPGMQEKLAHTNHGANFDDEIMDTMKHTPATKL